MKRRILSALLAFCMMLSLLPGTAWAAEAAIADSVIWEPIELDEEIIDEFIYEELDDERILESGIQPMSLEDGTVELKPTNEVRWIDRVDLPDYALKLYEVLEEAADGDGYHDYLIDDEYFDLNGDFDPLAGGEPGSFRRVEMGTERFTGILVTTTVTADTDQTTRDYIANCLRVVYSAFISDHPEVFWVNKNALPWRVVYRWNGTTYYYYGLSYNNQGENAVSYDARWPEFQPGGDQDLREAIARRDAAVEKILSTIPSGADQVTQIYYLNKWLTENNEYNTNIKESDTSCPSYTIECLNALVGSKGDEGPVCTGYAKAFKVLCDKLGIPCVYVNGYTPSGRQHKWNYVQMEDGNWYAVDVTYNDRNNDSANLTKYILVGRNTVVNRMEFLVSHLERNHGHSPSVKDFINGPVLNDEAYPRSVHLAYTGMPEKLAPGDSVTMTPVLIFGSNTAYTYSSTALPAGLTLNNDGSITGRVTDEADALTVTVTATNTADPADAAKCTLQFSVEAMHAKGDVTGDGDISIGDVVKLARAVAGYITLTAQERTVADVTGDGEISIGDVVKLARHVAGYITTLEP